MDKKRTRLKWVFISLLAIAITVMLAVGIAACGGGELTSLKVKTAPKKTKYIQGESFDPAGMVVVAVYGEDNEKEVTDYVLEPSTSKKLKVSDTSVKISWTEGEKTVTTKQRITVTNDITDVKKLTDPTKLDYMSGETFDPAGMTVELTYQDGTKTTKAISEIPSLVSYSNSGILTAADSQFTVTVAGTAFNFTLNINDKAVFIEAENGLLNGKQPGNDNVRDDATLDKAQEGAKSMFEAQLKANFKKQNSSMGEEELKAALETYVASDDYKNALDAYLISPLYAADVEHYHASGERYLGEIGKGDKVSFLFNSDKAGTGNISFRLASGYLLQDEGWKPIKMGSIKFKDLCEFYVNGVKYDIGDAVTLEGGESPDGTPNQILWFNWKNVPFENVSILKGRNVIELKILNFTLNPASSQKDCKGTPNIDSLMVESQECALSPIFEDEKITYATDGVTLAEDAGKVVLTVSGSYTVPEGYSADLMDKFSIVFGFDTSVKGDVVIADGRFTVTADISGIVVAATYTPTLDGNDVIKTTGVTAATTEIVKEVVKYTLTVSDNSAITVVVSINVEGSIELTNATLGKDIKLEVRDNKMYYVIAGGTYTATVTGYEGQDELKNRILTSKLKDYFYFDLQGNPFVQSGGTSWNGDWELYCKNTHTVTVGADNSFELAVDITDLYIFSFTTHCAPENNRPADPIPEDQKGWCDFKPDMESFTKSEVLGGKKYEMSFTKGGSDKQFWGCVGVKVTEYNEPVSDYNFTITTSDDKALNGQTGGKDGRKVDTQITKTEEYGGMCVPLNVLEIFVSENGTLHLSQKQINDAFSSETDVTVFSFHVMHVPGHKADCEVEVNGKGNYTLKLTTE